MNLVATQAAEKKLLLQTYDRHPILLTRGEGVYLFDDAGNRYLDLLSGIGGRVFLSQHDAWAALAGPRPADATAAE